MCLHLHMMSGLCERGLRCTTTLSVVSSVVSVVRAMVRADVRADVRMERWGVV